MDKNVLNLQVKIKGASGNKNFQSCDFSKPEIIDVNKDFEKFAKKQFLELHKC